MSACIATKVFTKNGNYFIKSYVMCDHHYGSEIRQIIFDWNRQMTAIENHGKAAMALAKKLNWNGEWISGDAGDQYIWTRQHPIIQFGKFSITVEDVEND